MCSVLCCCILPSPPLGLTDLCLTINSYHAMSLIEFTKDFLLIVQTDPAQEACVLVCLMDSSDRTEVEM